MELGIYVHIPFCLRKCNYCDFVSYPGCDAGLMLRYVRAVAAEAALYHDALADQQPVATSIYIGGGTPTVLRPDWLVEILLACRRFGWRIEAEVTVEANPGTVSLARLAHLRAAGVNRLSLGAQAFQKRLLAEMGRAHSAGDIVTAFFAARRAGFKNINLDLICGLPGQSAADWRQTLERAAALAPEHIAAYGLKLEQGTPWGRLYRAGRLQPADEELSLAMYQEAITFLESEGYRQYEISNFALPGYQSAHNRLYWLNREYVGLGVAAAGYLGHRRYTNVADLERYLAMVNEGQLPVAESEELNVEVEMAETVFLGLRLLEGLDLDDFERRFGTRAEKVYASQIARFQAINLLVLADGHLSLTPQALPVSNEVFCQFV